MAEKVLMAQTIARPLAAELPPRPFAGRVLAQFTRVVNLVDAQRRVIAIVRPDIGRGPFAVTVDAGPDFFDSLSPGLPAWADAHGVSLGNWRILLTHAEIWEPALSLPNQPLELAWTLPLVGPYANWPSFNEDTVMAQSIARTARRAARQLGDALSRQDMAQTTAAARQLAGLGHGLTPAGDDFLLGVTAALHLTRRAAVIPHLILPAISQTNALSGAFLQAAARQEFIEPWHHLALALSHQDKPGFTTALQQVAQFGASSGRDALAGLAQTFLCLTNPSQIP